MVLYTTLYREGGAQFAQAAMTLVRRLETEQPRRPVLCRAVESKRDFAAVFEALASAGSPVDELHFIGHSGVYGIMFGTTRWPEQFSPWEWRQLHLPLDGGSRVYFHACRTARWFAPFFARTFGVTTYGYHWYTTLSRRPDRFVWERRGGDALHVISCTGRKSHGWPGALQKHLGWAEVYPMLEFHPERDRVDASYDAVAELYDETFDDIAVRDDEVRWLTQQLGDTPGLRVLDIGCGNGALLDRLAPRLGPSAGVDLSERMLEHARRRNARHPQLSFHRVEGPVLPFADASFDRVVSVLSFRYLDWDPMVREIVRVLKPGGELLVVDMVAAPVRWHEWPRFLLSKLKLARQRLTQRRYVATLRRMVNDRRWQEMLKHNPIRAEHELRWYLESRFPPARVQLLNIGWGSRIVAFRSGPVTARALPPLTYP